MIEPYQVKDTTGRVYRVNAESPEAAMQLVATRHGVAVVAWRESRDAQDAIRVGFPTGGTS